MPPPSSAAPSGAALKDDEFQFEDWTPRFNPWVIAFTVTLATFMEALDSSIANVALPHIAGSLGASQDEATWVLTSYLVSNAIVLPISGWISNRIGRKRFYMSCVATFTLFSFLCGLAPTLTTLILCRIFQGAAGGGLQPSERSILADTFAPEKRSMAFSIYGMAVVLAPAIGPTVGGWITDNYSWRWIFFLNIPVGILSIFLTHRIVEDPPYLVRMMGRIKNSAKNSVDGIGLGLLALTVGAAQIVFDKGQQDDWFGSSFIVTCSILAALGLVLFLYREFTVENPIIDLRLYASRNFAMTQIVMLLIGASLFATTVMIPQFLQNLMGYTATKAGLALSIGGLVLMVLFPLIGFVGKKLDPRFMITLGFVILTYTIWRIGDLDLNVSFGTVLSWRAAMVVAMPMLFVPISIMSFVGVPQEKTNEVSGLTAFARNIGGSIGISFVTTLITRRTDAHSTYLSAHVTATSSAYHSLLAGMQGYLARAGAGTANAAHAAASEIYRMMDLQAATLAYVDAIHVLALLIACLIPLGYLMKKPRYGSRPSSPE